MGNHDAFNQAEWTARFGPTYYSQDFGRIRVIVIDCTENPNAGLGPVQKTWFLAELEAAANDPGVTSVIIAAHKIYQLKMHERYEFIHEIANGWYFEFSPAGYDVGEFSEEIWPSIVDLAAQKPTVYFAGDTGTSTARPALFFDTLDGVHMVACGTRQTRLDSNDAFLFAEFVDETVAFQVVSPWGEVFAPVETYSPAYWDSFYAETPTPPVPTEPGPTNALAVWLPPGTFEMGDHLNLQSDAYMATTGYTVTLSPFYMMTKEVTVGQYVEFLNFAGNDCGGAPCLDLTDPDCQIFLSGSYEPRDLMDTDLPLVEVTWFGALGYANYKSSLDGLDPAYLGSQWNQGSNGWRLPTDAEFEYAMRGGEGYAPGKGVYHRFPWSDDSPDHIHEHANSVGVAGSDVWEGLAPVGSFAPNRFGLYDMSGNAFEWTFDPWTWPWVLQGTVEDPVGSGWPGHPEWRVIRGGGFNYHWTGCRNGYRSAERDTASMGYLGFRLVRSDLTASSTGGRPGRQPEPSLVLTVTSPKAVGTSIGVHLASRGLVSLTVFDALGGRVRDLGTHVLPGGTTRLVWDGRSDSGRHVGGGVYFLRAASGEARATAKIALVH
jgi:formylglycine-generating enzyme required for sulfatase activity